MRHVVKMMRERWCFFCLLGHVEWVMHERGALSSEIYGAGAQFRGRRGDASAVFEVRRAPVAKARASRGAEARRVSVHGRGAGGSAWCTLPP